MTLTARVSLMVVLSISAASCASQPSHTPTHKSKPTTTTVNSSIRSAESRYAKIVNASCARLNAQVAKITPTTSTASTPSSTSPASLAVTLDAMAHVLGAMVSHLRTTTPPSTQKAEYDEVYSLMNDLQSGIVHLATILNKPGASTSAAAAKKVESELNKYGTSLTSKLNNLGLKDCTNHL